MNIGIQKMNTNKYIIGNDKQLKMKIDRIQVSGEEDINYLVDYIFGDLIMECTDPLGCQNINVDFIGNHLSDASDTDQIKYLLLYEQKVVAYILASDNFNEDVHYKTLAIFRKNIQDYIRNQKAFISLHS